VSGSVPRRRAAFASAAISPARSAAFEILTRVNEGKGHSDDLLHSHWTAKLSVEDRALATALVMGVLRWQIALDARLGPLLARPEQNLAPAVAISLRIGAFQLLYMDRIPPHAALNESVEICRAAGQPHAAGMVNAVLRKIARTRTPSEDVGACLAAHPAWLVERWIANYGRDRGLAICEYDQHEPPQGSLFVDNAEHLPQIDNGSRLVAEIAAAAVPDSPTGSVHVWDACAAPGGKTQLLALRLPDAELLATDVSARRIAHMKQRLHSFPYAERVRCEVMDATERAPETPSSEAAETQLGFDLVLCDVPCSGTGTLARNPEIRLRLRPEELPRQAARQQAILQTALTRVAPGGRLVYSTCSLEPEENEHVVEAVMRNTAVRQIGVGDILTRLAAQNVLPGSSLEMLSSTAISGRSLRTLPGIHPCDGFYATVLERSR
jgi:16S rRNA (cytosine967-C5)-methyltransferase